MQNDNFLSAAKVVFLVLAWIVLVIGLIGALGIFVTGGAQVTLPDGTTSPAVPKYLGIIPLIQGCIGFFIFFTISKIIKTLLDVKASCNKPSV